MPKIQESGGLYFISLPKVLVKQKKWTKGMELSLMYNERGNIELFEVKP